MSTVFLCSPTNSQMFTTCCEVAICDDEKVCPRCKRAITPEGRNERWRAAFDPIKAGRRWYGNHRPNDRIKP